MLAASSTLSARGVALDVLQQVLDRKRNLDEALSAAPQLHDRDRHFMRAMVMMTLRRVGQIDDLLAHFIDKPLPTKLWQVQHALRLGVAQLLWMDVPPHAAVHATVDLVSEIGFSSHKGFANAILQRTVREGQAFVEKQNIAQLNTPSWLWNSWVHAYGEPAARHIALAHANEPPLDISVKSHAAQWASGMEGMVLPTGTVRVIDAGPIQSLPGYQDGSWWIQDAAASLPAMMLGDVKGKTVVDLCAAPGGKTAQLAAVGAHVIAVDRSAARMDRLRKNLDRLQLSAECQVMDALEFRTRDKLDAILLDAPCTATGTLRRNPDIAWHRREEDITRVAAIQQKLILHALDLLQPGGILVYAVCSLQPEEGEKQLNQLLNDHRHVRIMSLKPEEIGNCREFITRRGELRTLPSHWPENGGLDGFYAVRLQRV